MKALRVHAKDLITGQSLQHSTNYVTLKNSFESDRIFTRQFGLVLLLTSTGALLWLREGIYNSKEGDDTEEDSIE